MILDEDISKTKWPGAKKNRGMSNGNPCLQPEPAPHSLTLKLAAFRL